MTAEYYKSLETDFLVFLVFLCHQEQCGTYSFSVGSLYEEVKLPKHIVNNCIAKALDTGYVENIVGGVMTTGQLRQTFLEISEEAMSRDLSFLEKAYEDMSGNLSFGQEMYSADKASVRYPGEMAQKKYHSVHEEIGRSLKIEQIFGREDYNHDFRHNLSSTLSPSERAKVELITGIRVKPISVLTELLPRDPLWYLQDSPREAAEKSDHDESQIEKFPFGIFIFFAVFTIIAGVIFLL